MASPVVESNANTLRTTAETTSPVNLPATVTAGAALAIFGRVCGVGTVAAPAGWTVIQDSSDASDDVSCWIVKDTGVVGNEDGTTISVTHGNFRSTWVSMSITGGGAWERSAWTIGSSTSVDPPAITPLHGSSDYLYLWAGGGRRADHAPGNPAHQLHDCQQRRVRHHRQRGHQLPRGG